MQAKSTQARGIKAIAAAALLAGAVMLSGVAPASAAPNGPSTEIPDYQPPAHATVAITPQQGLAGSAISVKLTFFPLNVCNLPAIALRTKPGPVAGSTIVSLSFDVTKQRDGSYKGTLFVPPLAAPGTIYYADGGCVGPYLVSPPVPFVVTPPNVQAVPQAGR